LPNQDLKFSVVPGQDLQWQQVDCGTAGAVNFPDGEIHWLAAVLHLDTRTEVEFSLLGEWEQLFTALSVLDRTVEMVLFPGEGHGISGSWDNRVVHRTMLLEWFDRFCREQPEAWQDRWE